MSSIHVVRDNANNYFIINLDTMERWRLGNPTTEGFKKAVMLYGPVKTSAEELGAQYLTFRNAFLRSIGQHEPLNFPLGGTVDDRIYLDTRLGFTQPGNAVGTGPGDLFAPNEMERVLAGMSPDPFTGELVSNPQTVTAGDGTVFGANIVPEGDDVSSTRGPARDAVLTFLQDFGLESLLDEVDAWLLEGLTAVEIKQRLRQTEEYRQRFPGIIAIQEGDSELQPPSEQEYLRLERGYAAVLRTYGLPEGFYDQPEDFANFIAGNVSVSELEERVVEGVVAAQNAPQEVQDALRQFYGIENSTSALAAYYLDPERSLPEIEREFLAASIAGRAEQTEFGDLEQAEAERLAALGITSDEAQRGFTSLASNRQNFTALAGEAGGANISREEQLAAQFEGDADAQESIRRQVERRRAAFAGEDSGAALTQEGLVGLRSAST